MNALASHANASLTMLGCNGWLLLRCALHSPQDKLEGWLCSAVALALGAMMRQRQRQR
jgi:hypothetical protein